METWDTQLRKGGLELAVLLLLWRHRMYGLELLTSLGQAGFAVSEGTIYPLLNRLSTQGVISAEWVTGESGHPRKYYRLTASGLEQASRMVRQWTEFASAIDALVENNRFSLERVAPQKGAKA